MRGCYDCLLAARDEYTALVGSSASGPSGQVSLATRLFETDLLIAVREKELGLPPSRALADAHRLAASLPPGSAATRYVALAEAVPPSDLAVPGHELRAFRSRHADALGDMRDQIAWLSHGPLRTVLNEYLRLALNCAYFAQTDAGPPSKPRPAEALALEYRTHICGFGLIAALESVRGREPRFVETSLFIANTELALAPHDGPQRAHEHLAEAAAKWARSSAIDYLTASYDLWAGENEAALVAFDRTLAVHPGHERARLGRTICLYRLGRAQDAIDNATQLLELRSEYSVDALLWRARSHYMLHQLDEARTDIFAAKEQTGTNDILGLSGIITYELDDLDTARTDLTAALAVGPTDCTSRWYLALVEWRGRHWRQAGSGFSAAMTCFHDRAAESRARAAALLARTDVAAAYRESAASNLTASAEADRKEERRSALSGAGCFAAAGDAAAARALLDVAAEDPALAEAVTRVRAQLNRTPSRRRP